MAFAVVKFINENDDNSEETYSEVPTTWLSEDRKLCRWPNTKNPYHLMHAGTLPSKNWKNFHVELQGLYDSLKQARKKATSGNTTSEEETLLGKGKRKKQIPKKFVSDSDSSSESAEDDHLPIPPKMRKVINTNRSIPDDSQPVADSVNVENEHNILDNNNIVDINSADIVIEEITDTPSTSTLTISSSVSSDLLKHLKFDVGKLLDVCNNTQLYVRSIDARLRKIESPKVPSSTSNDQELGEMLEKLPLKTIADIKSFETELSNKNIAEKFVQYIRNIGGRHYKDTTNRILKKVFSNQLGIHCSWLGQRNNFRVCNLKIIQCIKDVILGTNAIQEKDFEIIVSEWFRLSKLRLKREKTNDEENNN